MDALFIQFGKLTSDTGSAQLASKLKQLLARAELRFNGHPARTLNTLLIDRFCESLDVIDHGLVSLWSVACDDFVQIQNRSSDAGPGGEFGFIEVGGRWLGSDGEQIVRGGDVSFVVVEMRLQQVFEDFGLGGIDVAGDGSAEGEVESVTRSGTAVSQNRFGEGSRGFDVARIVEQDQRLQRRVRACSVGGAFLAVGGVEREQAGMQVLPLPVRVEAAAVQALASIVLPFTSREVEVREVARGLIRLDAFAAELRHEQAADRQRVVAHEFGVNAEAALPREPAVVRVQLAHFATDERRLPIRLAHDNRLDEQLHVPAGLDERRREVIEQQRVARPFALSAEVIELA